MSILLRVFAAVVSLLFTWFVLYMIRKERFLLKYAMLWLVVGILGFLAALFPGWVFSLSWIFGFESPSNFLFFVCVIFLMATSLVLCAIVSRQTKRITNLVQVISIELADRDQKHLITTDSNGSKGNDCKS